LIQLDPGSHRISILILTFGYILLSNRRACWRFLIDVCFASFIHDGEAFRDFDSTDLVGSSAFPVGAHCEHHGTVWCQPNAALKTVYEDRAVGMAQRVPEWAQTDLFPAVIP
jgi:hypothetical protein